MGHADFLGQDWFNELAISTCIGAGMGGVTAEIKGGDFWQGAASGAAWSAAGYVLSSVLNKDPGQKEKNTLWYKLKQKVNSFVDSLGVTQVGGVNVLTINGVGYLDPSDETLNAIIKPDIQRVNKWPRFPWPSKMMDREGDTAFKTSSVHKWFYKGHTYDRADVNYILQGHIHAHVYGGLIITSDIFTYGWKIVGYRCLPSYDTLDWKDKGFYEYDLRKDW